jgi:hypothetical protein
VTAVRLSPEAGLELAEASEWYASRRVGLEDEFLAEVERVLALIAAAPSSFPRLLDLPEDLIVRRALLPRFPYAIVFMGFGSGIRVLAVAHAKRRPGYWLTRVRTVPD